MKLQLQAQKLKHLFSRKKKTAKAIVFLFVLITGGLICQYLVIKEDSNPNVQLNARLEKCKKLTESVKVQVDSQKFQEAYDSLKLTENSCSAPVQLGGDRNISVEEESANIIRLYAYFATAASKTGRHEEGKQYAEKALSLNSAATSDVRSLVPDQNKLITDMVNIKIGIFDISEGGGRPKL